MTYFSNTWKCKWFFFCISFIYMFMVIEWGVPTSKEHTTYMYIQTNYPYMLVSIYALDHSQVLYIYYKLLQCRCLHFIETRIQILHYSSRKQVHSIIQTNLNANCSSTCLLCFYIDVCICSRQLLNIYWIILLSYVSNSMPTYFTL